MADSLAADSLAMMIPADSADSLAVPADSVYRLLKGFRDVRIYRSDFQAVCDSRLLQRNPRSPLARSAICPRVREQAR